MNAPSDVQAIGANLPANLRRATAYFGDLSKHGSTAEELIAHLDATVETALAKLEDCLTGHDSFDAFAFIRMVAGPWDFADVQESGSVIETSQAAQDVVALTLLGMGLPRRPLTGENNGQPDIGKALGLAGSIVNAARTRAILSGQLVNEPLGQLAGKFLGYELSVRGRQYQSIATELNTALLGDQSVAQLLKGELGFSLDDVRAVREAAMELLNERFFGARDRAGDFAETRSGDAQNDRPAGFLADINLMLNECRLFGAVTASDVADHARIDETTASAVLMFFSTAKPAAAGDTESIKAPVTNAGDNPRSAAANPVTEFVRGRIVAPWGCLADGDQYLLMNGFLAEDELRRNIERALTPSPSNKSGSTGKVWSRYDKRRSKFSEAKSAEVLTDMLAGTAPTWEQQKYLAPVSHDDIAKLGEHSSPSGIEMREFESDLLFVVDGVALCVEVKAGSVTEKARGGNAKRLATDLEKTLKDGSEQADRLAQLIRTNRGVWTASAEWIAVDEVEEIHSIIVMLDDMGPLSLSMNELANKGIIETTEVPWIVSIHDLLVICRTVDHPAQLLEYIRRRRGRKLATMVEGVDELDLFMWFLNGGMYFTADPHDVAGQLPIDQPVKPADARRFERQLPVRLGTLTDALDAWYYANEGLSSRPAPKPTRHEEPWVEEYLTAASSAKTPGWLRFGADLVGLSSNAQRKIGSDLKKVCRQARKGGPERSLTTHGTTSTGSWLLTAVGVPRGANIDHVPRYMDDKQYQTAANRSMLLLYDTDGALTGSRYRGSPQERTPERDAAIAVAPLLGLSATFTKVPPSARRSTKQLRGKKGKGSRR